MFDSNDPIYGWPFGDSQPRPAAWGTNGRVRRMIVDRTLKLEQDLGRRGYACKVGGDTNFFLEDADDLTKYEQAREHFVTEVRAEALAELKGIRHAHIAELRAVVRSFNLRECFMYRLSKTCANMVERNFPDCDYANNPLGEKPLQGYFDGAMPEFQQQPVSCEHFLRNLNRVHANACELAAPLGLTVKPGMQHIHFSLWKDGVAVTRRSQHKKAWQNEEYHPPYLDILAGVAHMARLSAPLLTRHSPRRGERLRVAETKLFYNDEVSIRACEDNLEFRADQMPVPDAALDLLLIVAGTKLGIVQQERNVFSEYGITPLSNATKDIRSFERDNMMASYMNCAPCDKDGRFLATGTGNTRLENAMDITYFGKYAIPPLMPQLLANVTFDGGRIVVPEQVPVATTFIAKAYWNQSSQAEYDPNSAQATATPAVTLIDVPKPLREELGRLRFKGFQKLLFDEPWFAPAHASRADSLDNWQRTKVVKDYAGAQLTVMIAKAYRDYELMQLEVSVSPPPPPK